MTIRVGVDTGGTFTDIVVLDEDTGRLVTTKTPSTPADPSLGFLAGVDKGLSGADADWEQVASVFHGTTVATNALLQGEVGGLGFLTTAGFRHLLEIGRQSVPDGYGNSYFWVKPDRIVPLHLVREVRERLDATGEVLQPLDEADVAAQARWFRDHDVDAVGVCLLHAYANPVHEQRVRDVFADVHPACSVSISSDVLREYREYERSVTTLVDAFVKPSVADYVRRIDDELARRAGQVLPFFVMKSNGGVASPRQVAAKPITTVLSGPAAGALGAAAVTAAAGFEAVVTLDGGGTSTDVAVLRDGHPSLTTDATVGRFPAKVPMIDIVTVGAGGGSVAWVSPEGVLKVGPRSAGADPGPCCYGRGGTDATLTDAALVLGRIPPHLLGGEIPLDAGAARAGVEAVAAAAGLSVERCAAGILEIGAWNQANAIRQVTVRRGIDVRDLALCAFGGSGPLQAGRLLDVLDLPAAIVPADPGNLCALGLLTVDVRIDDVRTFVAAHDRLDVPALASVYAELEAQAEAALTAEGFTAADHRFLRAAELRYDGQAFEVRVDVPAGPVDARLADTVVDRFHDEHERLYGYCYRDRPNHGVEWVAVRLTGVGALQAPPRPQLPPGDGSAGSRTSRPVFFDGTWHETPVWWRADLGAGDEVVGPAVIEEYGSTVPVPPGVTATATGEGALVLRRLRATVPGDELDAADPILLEIVEGSLAAIEAEVEDQIGRTSRSPMIRDQHDFRAGIHDRRLRKLTGRSYSALVHPVVRDFPMETMRPGDIYFHNDVYLSEGGIGHLPDLCVTVPVFHEGEVVAFVQAFGHHDDIGGSVPGSMPSRATSVFEEGLMVPPVKLRDAGVPNEGVVRILTRNSRMPDSIAGDLDAECSACLAGAARVAGLFERYGRAAVEACFDAVVTSCTETFRRELLGKIPDGTWTWEDYAEHDGVDEPRLHRQRITLTKTPDRLILDLAGTSPQAKGPINHAGDYADGNFLKKWLAPILRNLADTPERMAQLDVNEGVVDLIDIRFPPPGTLVTPIFPAPTNARTFVILRLLGVLAGVIAKAVDGYMPADQETIRYTGISGDDADGRWYLNREILGGGSGGRYYADGSDTIHVVPESRNLPVEFVETRFPVRIERLGLATDSGGAGTFRGGLGYCKEIRVLHDASYMSVADRSILSCWGVRGGRAGAPFTVTIDPGGPAERVMPGLCDWEPVCAGEVIRIETTGGGGWGDPLDREAWRVALDVRQGKVSRAAAEADYGVVLTGGDDDPVVDEAATAAHRTALATVRGPLPMFDRGPGFVRLSGGATEADVDR